MIETTTPISVVCQSESCSAVGESTSGEINTPCQGRAEESSDVEVPSEQGAPPSRPVTAFTVHLGNGKRGRKPPSALGSRHTTDSARKQKQAPMVDYTADEDQLMAEIVREARLTDLREKCKQIDIKLFDAHRRRLVYEFRNEQLQKQAAERKVVDATERRKLVKQMADEMRRKAKDDKIFTNGLQLQNV